MEQEGFLIQRERRREIEEREKEREKHFGRDLRERERDGWEEGFGFGGNYHSQKG